MLTNLLFTLATAASGALAAPQWARQADNEGGVGPISPGKPAGGASNASTPPPEYVYKSDFDFQSLNLALNQGESHQCKMFLVIQLTSCDQ